MHTLDELLKKEPVYLNDWAEGKEKDLLSEFQILSVPRILFASYGYQDYSGDVFVLYEENGKLYEVNGGHCSCYGLEGQFEGEETDLKAIEFRLINGSLGNKDYSGNEFRTELMDFLGISL